MSQETKIKTRIQLLEMEKGFLSAARRTGTTDVGSVASELEVERETEIKVLKGQLQELGMAS